ncbi:MAG: DUF4340 domain-containing protein, partial [Herbinix sp.]|nr:DUF4340 domain-containing protein [Herbinix sp.]
MTKRKKRNAVTLVSLLLALIALIGVYIWYSNKSAAEDSTEGPESIPVATLDTTKVTALHYIGDDVDINFVLEDGVWKSKEELNRPINQDNITSMLSTISEITAYQKVVETPDNLADFGLDNPSSYIQATLEDGSTVTLSLGAEAVTGDGNYALVNDDTAVYLVKSTYKAGLSFTNLDMTKVEAAPEITAENITYLNIDSRDGEDVELKYNDVAVNDNSGSNMYNWQILKPYGGGFSADTDKVAQLQANYTKFDFLGCVDYKGDDLSKYGLEDPAATIDIGYYETYTQATPTPASTNTDTTDTSDTTAETMKINKEYKIFIGDKDENGDYYVRSDGSNAVYTLSSDTVDTMLQVEVF